MKKSLKIAKYILRFFLILNEMRKHKKVNEYPEKIPIFVCFVRKKYGNNRK